MKNEKIIPDNLEEVKKHTQKDIVIYYSDLLKNENDYTQFYLFCYPVLKDYSIKPIHAMVSYNDEIKKEEEIKFSVDNIKKLIEKSNLQPIGYFNNAPYKKI